METHLDLNSFEEDEPLKDVLISLWATHGNKIVLLLSVESVSLVWKKNKLFPSVVLSLSRDAKGGIEPLIDSFAARCTCLFFLTL